MSKIIYKYPLQVQDKQTIKLPSGYKILTVQVQDSIPCLWAMVDTSIDCVEVNIITYGTGSGILSDEELRYIGTYQLNNGVFVFHVFESKS